MVAPLDKLRGFEGDPQPRFYARGQMGHYPWGLVMDADEDVLLVMWGDTPTAIVIERHLPRTRQEVVDMCAGIVYDVCVKPRPRRNPDNLTTRFDQRARWL